MVKKVCFLLLGWILMVGTQQVVAQSLVEEVLKEPIQKALDNNADIQIKEKTAEMSLLDKKMVQSKRLPQVSVLGGYGYLYSQLNIEFPTHYLPITGIPLLQDPYISQLNTQVIGAGVTAQQIIFAGSQVSNGLKALEEKHKAEQLLAEAGKEEVIQEVITTFDQVMLLKEVDKLIDDSEKRLKKEQEKVQKAIENGLAIPYDRDRLKLALLELEEKRVEAEGNRGVLYAKLRYLTGMEVNELKAITYELTAYLLENKEYSPENRLELQALESGKKAKEYVYKKEKGDHWPSIFAFGNLTYLNAFDSSLKLKDRPLVGDVKLNADHLRLEPAAAIGIGMKWDIFKGGETRKKVQKAALDVSISETQLKDTREKLELLVQKNQVDYQTAEKRMLVADQQVVVAENNLDLASRQYASGLIDLTERLASENDFYKVSLNYYNQVLNQRKKAVELLASTGELLTRL